MKNILRAIMSLLLFVACTTTEESPSSVPNGGNESVTPSITLEQNYLNFDEHADVQTISFSSTMDWTAELINDRADGWCSISATSGTAGSKDINVTVTENTSTDDRTASVIIKSGAISKTVRISQKQRDALTVTSSTFEIEGTSGKIYIEVKANVDFEYTINGSAAEWITPIETRAMKTTTLGFNIAENKTMQRREGTITIHSGDLSETVTVYQKDHGDAILLSHNEYVVSDTGEDIAVEVTSNVDVEIEMPDVDWITRNTSRAVSTNTYYFTIAENTTYDQREAYITFKNTEKKISERVKVSQVQKDAIVLAAEQYNVTSEGEQITIELGHNVDFEYEIVGDWITHVETRALQTNYLVFEVASNASYDSREGSVIFTANNGSLTQVAKIFQAQRDAIIISDNDIVVSDASQQISFDVETNIDFSVIDPDVDWLHPVVTRGLTTHTLTYTVDENTTYDSREAQIVVKNNATNITQTVTVTQAQKDAIVLAKSEYEIELEGGALDFDIQTNVEVSVSISEDAQSWITRVQTRGLETRTLYFDIAPYDGDATREGTITISGGNATQTINICQFSWQTLEDNKIYYTSSDGKVVTPNENSNWGGARIISNTYEKGQGVITFSRNLTEIGGEAFRERKTLTSITIPSNVEAIRWSAFQDCDALTSITIPNSVKTIESHTFAYCEKLAEVSFGSGLETIGGYAFNCCSALTSITIPDNVKTIQNGAFANCNNLANLDLGNGVEIIGGEVFTLCNALKSVTIPQSVKEITGNPFAGCSNIEAFYGKFVSEDNSTIIVDNQIIAIANYENLTEYTIPNGITKIAELAFYNWWNIQTINIPDSVTEIGANAFNSCHNLHNINIPEGITEIKGGTFNSCGSLTQITLPSSLKTIEVNAFSSTGLTDITIPDSVTDIQGGAFASCDKLTSFRGKFASEDNKSLIIDNKLIAYAYSGLTEYIIPEGVTTLGTYSFLWVISSPMATISLPNSLTTIEDWAFYDCRTISEITLPENVTYIGGLGFCENLSKIYCKATTPPTLNGNPFEGSQTPTHTIYVPSASVMAYRSAPGWSDYASMIVGYDFDKGVEIDPNTQIFYTSSDGKVVNPNAAASWGGATIISNTYKNGQGVITFSQSLTEISDNAFEGCSTLTGVNLPNSVEIIKEHAFIQCTSLRSITLPTSVTTIEVGAFMLCSSLSSITIPNSVTVIKGSAFCDCISLTSIIIPDSVTKIEGSAFEGCSNLTEIQLSKNLKSINTSTFWGCKSLKSIAIPYGVTEISDNAFIRCSTLTSVTIPESVTIIGSHAFYECYSLANITIPKSVTRIDDVAFASCVSLTDITIPDGVKQIRYATFCDCLGLESITIPKSVTTIEDRAFEQCSSLSKMYVKATTPPTISSSAFNNNANTPTIYVPITSVAAYSTADGWGKYVSMIAGYDFDNGVEIDPNAQIYYTSSHGNIVNPSLSASWGGANIVSNTYENGHGVITFDKELTTIGVSAFSNCSLLTSVIIPNKVTRIESSAFEGCKKLTSLTLGNSVEYIGNSAFNDCNLTSVTIPNSVTTIESWAFRINSNLATLKLGENVKSIGDFAFYGGSLVSVEIPSSIETIETGAFNGNPTLVEFIDPGKQTGNIRRATSEDKRCLVVNETLMGIADGGLTEYDLPAYASYQGTSEKLYIKTIGVYTWANVDKSRPMKITLPEGVTKIEHDAFWNHQGVQEITLPNSITMIDYNAFAVCINLSKVYCKATIPPTMDDSNGYGVFYGNPSGRTIYVPRESVDAYKSAPGWSNYADAIQGYDF